MENNKKKVLLVDDEEQILNLIVASLEPDKDTYDVLMANSGEEALEILKKEKSISVIVTDIKMTGMTGLDLYGVVREEYPDAMVIIMTGHKTEEVLKEVQASGCMHFIEKPFKNGHIKRLISELINRSDEGFVGTMKNIHLTDLIQMCCLSSEDIDIHVRKDDKKGIIYITQGEIVHAICDDEEGEKAFFGILGWTGGRFETQVATQVEKSSIEKGWQYLLMEGARKADEMKRRNAADEANNQQPLSHENGKIRVMIVDDSQMMCRIIKEALISDESIEVVGMAKNGEEALEKLEELKPDLITLDVNMPVMDGNTTLKYIMIKDPCPVSIISNIGSEAQLNILEFLRLGAVDFISKSSIKKDKQSQQQFIERVKLAASAKISKFKRFREPKIVCKENVPYKENGVCERIVIVNSGTGGYSEFINLISLLPERTDACVVALQTMPLELRSPLAEYLDKRSMMKVMPLDTEVKLTKGRCYMGVNGSSIQLKNENGNYHLIVEDNLEKDGVDICSFDNFLSDVAKSLNDCVQVALLSGAEIGDMEGLKSIKEKNGKILVQELNSCMVPYTLEDVVKAELAEQEAGAAEIVGKIFK
ncbi:MAG: response regulator [Deltaproteobacteria bacterium]|nr:response regulator [Deltaproteobacteria bacterium]